MRLCMFSGCPKTKIWYVQIIDHVFLDREIKLIAKQTQRSLISSADLRVCCFKLDGKLNNNTSPQCACLLLACLPSIINAHVWLFSDAPSPYPLNQHMETTPKYFTLRVLTWYRRHPLNNQREPSKVTGRGRREGPLNRDKATELAPPPCVVQLRWLMTLVPTLMGSSMRWRAVNQPGMH